MLTLFSQTYVSILLLLEPLLTVQYNVFYFILDTKPELI
jgi:hypothetical protein